MSKHYGLYKADNCAENVKMSVKETLACSENGIFGWNKLFGGTSYAHLKHIECRETYDTNKISLSARSLQLLDEKIVEVYYKERKTVPETWTIEEKGPFRTVLKVTKDTVSLERLLRNVLASKIEITHLNEFKSFVQKLSKESYDILKREKKPTHGIPTLDNEVQEETENSATGDRNFCKICLGKELDILVMPCRHLCLCVRCAEELKNRGTRDCPICRVLIDEFIKVFKC